MLPEFTATGDLPVGVHRASLREVLARFGGPEAQRVDVGRRLERIYQLAMATRQVARFIVFGSFITDKPEPQDVDVFILMHDSFESTSLAGETELLFDHGIAQMFFGASVFWVRRFAAIGGEQTAVEDWQIKRDGTRRGIVEITGW